MRTCSETLLLIANDRGVARCDSSHDAVRNDHYRCRIAAVMPAPKPFRSVGGGCSSSDPQLKAPRDSPPILRSADRRITITESPVPALDAPGRTRHRGCRPARHRRFAPRPRTTRGRELAQGGVVITTPRRTRRDTKSFWMDLTTPTMEGCEVEKANGFKSEAMTCAGRTAPAGGTTRVC
jgi:hypothetical protein